MYRPSQTPHPTLSSARIASQNKFPTERKKLKATERTKTPGRDRNPRTRPHTPTYTHTHIHTHYTLHTTHYTLHTTHSAPPAHGQPWPDLHPAPPPSHFTHTTHHTLTH